MRKIWLVIPLVLVIGASAGAYAWWQSPATTDTDQGTQEVNSVLGSETAVKPWQTSYFSTSIPTTLRVKTSNDSATYGSYLLTSISTHYSDQIGVTVAELGGNSLDEIPAVRLRLDKPDVYAPGNLSYAPDGAYVFTDEDGYETSIFWQHGNQYAAVVASGTSARRAELGEALADVVSNWNWQ
jgi:hypothetical protein